MPQIRPVRQRIAGQSAMSRVIAAQASAPPRTPAAVFFGVSPLRPELGVDYRAALAELEAGDVLEGLGQRWDVLHDLPVRDDWLDHLVIGPTGVFAVRTLYCGGRDAVIDGAGLTIGGQLHDDLALARAAAEQVSHILGEAIGEPLRVRALLVMVEARRIVLRVPVAAARVVAVRDLERMLTRGPHVLSGEQVAAFSDAADRAETWPPVDAAGDTRALRREFAGIRALVRHAITRRVLWAIAAFALGYGIIWGLVVVVTTVIGA